MTHYLKNPVTGYVPVETEDRPNPTRTALLCAGLCLAFFLGAAAQRTNIETVQTAAFLAGDSAARSDYADLVNSCYDRNRDRTADALYSCIAGSN